MFAGTACAGFLLKLIDPAIFMGAVATVLAFYFGAQKGQKDDINTPDPDARTTSTVVSKTTTEPKETV